MSTDILHKEWLLLAKKYCDDQALIACLWEKIAKKYAGKNRYYHNLGHIHSMLQQAKENREQIIDFDALLFAIWFHDIIYKVSKKNNEEKSAEFASSVLKTLSKEKIHFNTVAQLIISTKSHQIILKENNDNAFMLDFDLSILGQDWEIYKAYIQNIRKEYKLYPDFLYNPSRRKILENFLNRKTLFYTKKYQDIFEDKARVNLIREIKLLS
jgi:predicted metal-dependent HD superfamily phosphohydrolase